MTERNVRRGMFVATIGVAGLLTALAVAGLVVMTRGPQVQALPLVRTLIAQDPEGPVAAESLAPTTVDHPPLFWPPPLHTTTTAPIMASLGETPGDSQSAARSRPSLSESTIYTYVPPSFPSHSAPPTTSGALTPPASRAPASAPAFASDVTSRTGTASSTDHTASSTDRTVSTDRSAAVGPVVSTTESATQPVEVKGEDPAEPDDDREVISPRLRVSTADDHDSDDSDDPDHHGD